MEIKELYNLYQQNFLVDIDTRNIRKGSIFFALKGPNFNGNTFAFEALCNGASYSVVDEEVDQEDDRILQVPNVLDTLQQLANYHRRVLNIPIIALTGSNGKTTTKELINTVLSKKFKTSATKGNLNNHIGVPLTLLAMDNETQIGIVEMGANHRGEIAALAKIVEPTIGYITNFGKAHLEGFGGVQGVIEGKSELYKFVIDTEGKLLINPEDPIQMEKSKEAHKIVFDNTISFVEANPFVCLQYGVYDIRSHLIGAYNYGNIAAAITIGNYFEVPDMTIKDAIESYVPTNNRSQIIEKGNNTIILDAYNANPTSMQYALENFKRFPAKSKMVILGDMFELGTESKTEHQAIVQIVQTLGFTKSIFVGKYFFECNVVQGFKFQCFNTLKDYLREQKFNDTAFLIKGSRGMALERCVSFI